jgi:hypothetical protein
MHTRLFARLFAAALVALALALSTLSAPAAQAAGSSSWQRLSATCTIRALTSPVATPLAESNSKLIVSSTGSQWTFYRDSSNHYAIELAGTGTFITSSSRSGVAVELQPYNALNPNTQLWTIQRHSSSYTFKNVGTLMYFFTMSGTVNQWLSQKSAFSLGASGSTCATYYTY